MTRVLEALDRHRERNFITGTISNDDWERWKLYSKLVRFEVSKPTIVTHHCFSKIIFPTTAIFSFSSESLTGGLAESSLVGSEGFVGFWKLATNPQSAMAVMLQTSGFGIVVPVEFINREVLSSSHFRLSILNYANSLVRYATQTCFCYRYHSIDQQVVKSILLTLRRTGGSRINMTHQTLATILGLRREAVSLAIRNLCEKNLMEQKRGYTTVLNLTGLEAQACECYEEICGFLGHATRPTSH
jgi:hypothetical protein